MDQMNQSLASFLPDSMSWAVGPLIAIAVIIVGYFIAKIAAGVVSGAINRTGLGKQAKTTGGNIGKSLSKAVFWVLWLVFILMGLSQFPMVSDALTPIQGMMDGIFAYLPQLITGGAVLAIGLMVAKVVKEALSSTLEAAQVDRLATKFGVTESADGTTSNSIARSLGGLASAIVAIFFAITAIGIWDIPGISEPVGDMLNMILAYIPRIFVAAVIIGITVFIARFVSNLAKNTLPALGVDNALASVGELDGQTSTILPSKVIATIGFVGITLMGLTAAMGVLGIPELTNVFNTLLEIGGRVVLGAVIIGGGIFIANFVAKFVAQTSGEMIAKVIKYAVIILITFMGLSAMELGGDIVNTAFEYSLGAGAVAAGIGGAIAFGLGGREWASKKLNEWMPVKTTRKK